MPVERLTVATGASTLGCLNSFWQYAREQGFFNYPNWTAQQLQSMINNGSKCWVYRRDDNQRVDGVCIFDFQQMVAPDSTVPERWLNVQILAVRANLLTTTPLKLRAIFIATKAVILEGLKRMPNVVGVTCNFERTNTELRILTDTFPNVQYEDTPVVHRAWFRRAGFITRFDQWVVDSGAGTEVIIE